MAPAIRNLAVILLLTATGGEGTLRGSKLHKHHKHHHAQFPGRPVKDSAKDEQPKAPSADAMKAGIVLMASRHQLDLFEQGAAEFISKKIAAMGENGVVTMLDKSMPIPGMPADAKGHVTLKDIQLSKVTIQAAENHELRVQVKLGFVGDADVKSKGQHVGQAHMAPLGTISLALGLLRSSGGQPKLELRKTDVQFDNLDMNIEAGGRQLISVNKKTLETPFTKMMLMTMSNGLKPKIVEFLNEKLAVMAPISLGQQLQAQPSFVQLDATEDGGISLAVDVAPVKSVGGSVQAEECLEHYPSMPHRTVEKGMKAMIALRVFNCFLKVAHRDGLLDMDKLTQPKKKGLSLAQTDADAEADADPLDVASMKITHPPRCHSSSRTGLVCDVHFTTSVEINGQKPKFNAFAQMGVALGIKSTTSSAIMVPTMTKCDGDFKLDMQSVSGLSRFMFAGLGAGLSPMVCKAMPSLVDLLPHVDLGPQFHGSMIDFEDDFVSVSTNVNPFDLKVLSLAQSSTSVHEKYPPSLRELYYHHDSAEKRQQVLDMADLVDPNVQKRKRLEAEDEVMNKAELAAHFNKGAAWVEEQLSKQASEETRASDHNKLVHQVMTQQGDFD